MFLPYTKNIRRIYIHIGHGYDGIHVVYYTYTMCVFRLVYFIKRCRYA